MEGGLNPDDSRRPRPFLGPSGARHAWLDGHPALRRRFGPEDYDVGRHEVGGMIFVQADCRDHEALDEARWAGELITRDPRVRGIVRRRPGMHTRRTARPARLLPGRDGWEGRVRWWPRMRCGAPRMRDIADGLGLGWRRYRPQGGR